MSLSRFVQGCAGVVKGCDGAVKGGLTDLLDSRPPWGKGIVLLRPVETRRGQRWVSWGGEMERGAGSELLWDVPFVLVLVAY